MRKTNLVALFVLVIAGKCDAQSLKFFNSLPPDWAGKSAEAYDIRLLDVSNDGRTAVGFVCPGNIGNYNGTGGSNNFYEDRWVLDTSGDFEPIVVRDGHIEYLPVPSQGEYYGGYANRISRDGKWITGGQKYGVAGNGISNLFETAKWNSLGNYVDPALPPRTWSTGISSDGGVICGIDTKDFSGFIWDNGVYQAFPERPFDITPDGTSCAWDPPDSNSWFSISGDATVRFGVHFSPDGCVFEAQSIREDANGTQVLWVGEGCNSLRFTDSNPDGTLAIGRKKGDLYDFGSVAYIWTADNGVQEFGAYLQARGIDLWQYLSGDDHLIVTAMNDDANVFVGYIKGAGRQFGGTGRDTGWIVDLRTGCYPDLAPDGTLDLFDFLAFVNLFNDQSLSADCDGNGALDLFDFLCFVNSFNTGC